MRIRSPSLLRTAMSANRGSRRSARLSSAPVSAAVSSAHAENGTATSNAASSAPKKPRARKAQAKALPTDAAPPATPPAKRVRRAPANSAAPLTPKPAAATPIAGLHTASDIDDALPPVPPPQQQRCARPAEPHATNAPLQTPRGSRVVAYATPAATRAATRTTAPVPPGHVPPPTSTTATLLQDACAHLVRADPRLAPLVARHHCRVFAPDGLAEPVDPFRALVSGICAQQVSGAAASAIKKKFMGLFNAPPPVSAMNGAETGEEGNAHDDAEGPRWVFPTPAQVAAADVARLRSAGLSQRKAEYVKGLAEQFVSGDLSARMLVEASYDEVLEKLTAVRGLGRWSVEMFACFALKRMDVFSTGDLGVQ